MSTGPDPKEKGSHGDSAKETAESGGLLAGIKKVMAWVKGRIGSWFETDNSSTAPKAVPAPTPTAPTVHGAPPAPAQAEVKKHPPLSPNLEAKLKDGGKKILDDIGALLTSETVKDTADLKIVTDAKAFIENPTESLENLMKQTTNVGQVLGGYEQQGEEAPPAIDAMHAHLLAMQCLNRIKHVEDKFDGRKPLDEDGKKPLAQALDWATILSKGYKDDTMLKAVNELRERLNSL